ncbi:MAG: CBS domain-containing protein [Treponema sp.]|jgi:putative hemolysin|nr:CBS domain-containing protein [Treponema sp.]
MDDSSYIGRLRAFLKKKITGKNRGITEAELRNALLEGEKSGVVESKERTMVEGVFYLGDRQVGAFMTHRSEIKWLDIDTDPGETRKTLEVSSGQLCFPIVNGDLDTVAGVASIQEIYKALLDDNWPGLRAIMRPPYFIPETMSALKAFEAFKKADANDLFIMDEYGGFAGILTVRNLIEEITGALSASGEEKETIIKQADGTWLAGGGVSIDDAARELELQKLGEEQNDYHTLAGFILYLAGEIPRSGACFDYCGYRFKVLDLDQNRINKVTICKIKNA